VQRFHSERDHLLPLQLLLGRLCCLSIAVMHLRSAAAAAAAAKAQQANMWQQVYRYYCRLSPVIT
jgi:hypothetical protein